MWFRKFPYSVFVSPNMCMTHFPTNPSLRRSRQNRETHPSPPLLRKYRRRCPAPSTSSIGPHQRGKHQRGKDTTGIHLVLAFSAISNILFCDWTFFRHDPIYWCHSTSRYQPWRWFRSTATKTTMVVTTRATRTSTVFRGHLKSSQQDRVPET